ncbi:MAG: stage 0 sporulation family protein [Chloroflexota bacterium]|nr:stage 0 sporulation family protein [Chloroflexota bacterium]
MPTVVGVSFRPVTRIYHFSPGDVEGLQAGDYVVVETSMGYEVGRVAWEARDLPAREVSGGLKSVLRRATVVDLVERDQYRSTQREVRGICRAKAIEHNMSIEVVGAEYSFDGTRLIVSFTAEGRVDFRALVRDLARTLNTRIEMKQIGVRDEAKVLDGIGKCGRQLCCASWLRDFTPVSIKMAKQQNLPLNPAEISGVCGRLLCCLAYEIDTYREARRRLPKVGAVVMTPEGKGRVRKVHALREALTVKLEDDKLHDFSIDDIEGFQRSAQSGSGCGGCEK